MDHGTPLGGTVGEENGAQKKSFLKGRKRNWGGSGTLGEQKFILAV